MKYLPYFLTISAIGFFVACSNERVERPAIASVAKNIQELIAAAPKHVIDLDALEGETLYPDLVIGGDSTHNGQTKHLFLAKPVALMVLKDSLYICDRVQNAIIVADRYGNLIRQIGRAGQAPGEFLGPYLMAKNDALIMVFDLSNHRIQIFDHAFRYLTSIAAAFLPPGSIAASSDEIFIHGNIADSNLVRVYEARPPYRLKRSFIPLVIPFGQQPMAMNEVKFSATRTGYLCVGYEALPYIFLFEPSGRHYATIEFQGRLVDDLDAPLPSRIKFPVSAIPVRTFINDLLMPAHARMILANGSSLYLLEFANDKFVLQRRFNLSYPISDLSAGEEDSFYIESLVLEGNRVYVSTQGNAEVLSYQILL